MAFPVSRAAMNAAYAAGVGALPFLTRVSGVWCGVLRGEAKICPMYFKICLTYFKICLTYFKICPTFFSPHAVPLFHRARGTKKEACGNGLVTRFRTLCVLAWLPFPGRAANGPTRSLVGKPLGKVQARKFVHRVCFFIIYCKLLSDLHLSG